MPTVERSIEDLVEDIVDSEDESTPRGALPDSNISNNLNISPNKALSTKDIFHQSISSKATKSIYHDRMGTQPSP